MLERGISTVVKEHFRYAIKRYRTERKLLQKDMARRFGVTISLYSHWENGVRFPTDEKLQEIAGSLGMSVKDLIGEEIKGETTEIPIVGEIPAGKSRGQAPDAVILHEEPSDLVSITWSLYNLFLTGMKKGMVALRVGGSALAPHYMPGDIVFVEPTGELPAAGKQVILDLPGEGHAIKIVGASADMTFLVGLTPAIYPMPMPKKAKLYGVIRGALVFR
ncbi:MAG: helix-turn-helix domain-containing protein [Actinobacteria bacterium]|nr:helix-turn-helix domain-containing protein [Actinomycetota bacterium]